MFEYFTKKPLLVGALIAITLLNDVILSEIVLAFMSSSYPQMSGWVIWIPCCIVFPLTIVSVILTIYLGFAYVESGMTFPKAVVGGVVVSFMRAFIIFVFPLLITLTNATILRNDVPLDTDTSFLLIFIEMVGKSIAYGVKASVTFVMGVFLVSLGAGVRAYLVKGRETQKKDIQTE